MFGWTERFNVAVGVAQALDYLHGNDNIRPVIHRDVKSSNILISEDFEPKVTNHCTPKMLPFLRSATSYQLNQIIYIGVMQLSDFGLALWATDATPQTTCNDVAGTFGLVC
jgi:serine/threonine protein kinase